MSGVSCACRNRSLHPGLQPHPGPLGKLEIQLPRGVDFEGG